MDKPRPTRIFAAPTLAALAVLACTVSAPSAKAPELFQLQTWPSNSASPALIEGEDALSAYAQVRSAAFAGWGPTGIWILTRMGVYPQIHRVALPLADRRQNTFFQRRVDRWYVNPVPGKRNALITLDQGGDEDYSLLLLDLTSGTTRPLSGPPGRVTSVLWNDSGSAFVYAHTPAGTDRWDIRMGSPDGRDTLLHSRTGTWTPMDWSPDAGELILQKYVSASESELHLLDLATGRLSRILPEERPQYYDHAVFFRREATGRTLGIAFTSDRDGAYHRLYLLGRGDSSLRALSPPVPWDVEWVATGGDRQTLVYSINEQGVSVLHALKPGSTLSGQTRLPNIPKGIIEGVVFHPSGREFGFTLNRSVFPGDAFSYRLNAKRTVRWTESETGGLSQEDFREPELVHYPTFDSVGGARRTIPAWLYLPPPPPPRPHPATAGSPSPVLVQIHGGPELQARPGFDPFIQYLTDRLGIAVILPNVRGSSGYGKDFLKADDGLRRLDAVKDIGALLEWIETRPDLDPTRVAVAGRSYGGFMALSSLVHFGDRLKGGISTVGITHFPSFLKETSGYRRDLRRAEYGDERDPGMAAFLDSISPIRQIDRLRLPLLLSHGRNDPRVPYAESARLFEGLKARKVPVWLLTFPQEGHAFRSEASQLVHYRVMSDFLARLLGTAGNAEPPKPADKP